jgi:EAL domain-containing protein (putative c-di-GMP-specific phosphodiesterase class I)
VIEFEITEGVMLDDDPRVAENIDQLLLRKFRIAIDDFGTGYSSLGYLHRLRVHNLKIDRSFVQGMSGQESGDKSALIDAIISMSKSLKIQITAEGVETNQQFSYLVERGCDLVQGFLFSKGLRKDEYVKYCRMAAIPVV